MPIPFYTHPVRPKWENVFPWNCKVKAPWPTTLKEIKKGRITRTCLYVYKEKVKQMVIEQKELNEGGKN